MVSSKSHLPSNPVSPDATPCRGLLLCSAAVVSASRGFRNYRRFRPSAFVRLRSSEVLPRLSARDRARLTVRARSATAWEAARWSIASRVKATCGTAVGTVGSGQREGERMWSATRSQRAGSCANVAWLACAVATAPLWQPSTFGLDDFDYEGRPEC